MLLGIDIGGTTISMGLVDRTGVVGKACFDSFRHGASLDETLEYLSECIGKVITPDVERIGVGVPTLVDPYKGIVYNAMNIPSWKEVHLRDFLEKRFGIPAAVNNDANCFALGAAAKLPDNYEVVVGVTLGTGTGVGIVVDGKIMCGANCGAGELCSVPYNGADYESFCSQKFFLSNGWKSGREAAEAAQASDQKALQFFEEFGRHLGEFLTLVVYAYDPGCIVIGGGIAHTAPWFKDSLARTLRSRYPYAHAINKLSIRFMPEDDIALLGASLL